MNPCDRSGDDLDTGDSPAPAESETHCGFIAILGAPNAGKSTLVNALVGQKVSIVTQKVQTTRIPVRGIAMRGKTQIIFVDTPGIFSPKRRLDRAMVKAAWKGADDADASSSLWTLPNWPQTVRACRSVIPN